MFCSFWLILVILSSANAQHFSNVKKTLHTRIISGLKLGEPADIWTTFYSKSKPLSIKWIINNRKIYYGKATDEYISKEISEFSEDKWIATLHIVSLTKENALLNYTLEVKNSEGIVKEYPVRIGGFAEESSTTYELNIETSSFFPLFEDSTIEEILFENEAESMRTIEPELTTEILNDFVETESYEYVERLETANDPTDSQALTTERADTSTEEDIYSDYFSLTTQDINDELPIQDINNQVTELLETTNDPIDSQALTTERADTTTEEDNYSDYFPSTPHTTTQVNNEDKAKALRVKIIKRPILEKLSSSTTEPTLEHSSVNTTKIKITKSLNERIENGMNFKSIEVVFVDLVSKSILFWKTSLMVVVILVLIASLSYYRRRIVRLKAEIVLKNLGNSYNQSCSYGHSANAYTPTHFQRRHATNDSKLCYPCSVSDSEYESSRSTYYAQTYNPSLHLYESIDENPYAVIASRKPSLASLDAKPNNYENNSVLSCE